MYKRSAFQAEAEFLDKLKFFAEVVVVNCVNHSEISTINYSANGNDNYVKSISEVLTKRSAGLRKAEQDNNIKKDLIIAIEQQDRETLENISNQSWPNIFDLLYEEIDAYFC